MKKYFKVTFKYSENTYCANIAHAETAADVEAHYKKYENVTVKEAASYEVEEATLKGMPIIEVEPAQVEEEAQTENSGRATLKLNDAQNGVEIYFPGKPDDDTRAELKAAGFRWHKVKKCWYAKQTEARIALAFKAADASHSWTAAPSTVAEGKAAEKAAGLTVERLNAIKEGYTFRQTGEGIYSGWTGCNNTRLYGQDLKKAILAELKKNGIKATARKGRGGYTTSFAFTVTVPHECELDEAEYIEAKSHRYGSFTFAGLYWFRDAAGNDWHIKQFDGMPFDEVKRIVSEHWARRYREEGPHPSEAFADAVKVIIDSFNSDHSNAMIDYFDKSFYWDVKYKAA